jgi:nitroreductase
MATVSSSLLRPILERRAVKSFEPVTIPEDVRQQILDAARLAPSSFNSQPYRFYWIESPASKRLAANCCLGQKPAKTASVLIAAVADIGSWESTAKAQLDWMRQSGSPSQAIAEYEKKSKIAKWLFVQGWFNILGALKYVIFGVLNFWKGIGMPPVSRGVQFKWATKSTALACENLMIAAEALGLNTCPMEGFHHRRLSRFLHLTPRYHEIVMVIALGKKSSDYQDPQQWRRPLESTVTFL